jgi:hypothetical protein
MNPFNDKHTLNQSNQALTIGRQPTGQFRPRELREQTCDKRSGFRMLSFLAAK